MARARNIKPAFFSNDELVELSFATRLLFIGLWTLADRAGRMEDRPKKIKMSLFPADDLNVDAALAELDKSGFILRYQVEEARFIQVLAFDKHQNPHRDEKASLIPAPCEHRANTVQPSCDNETDTVAIGLIPDSLNLIPDTGLPVEAAPEAKPPKAKPDATATRLPADWIPSYEDARFCAAERKDLSIDAVASQFRDYWIAQPGVKGRKADWSATWRNWVRNQRATHGPPGYQTANDKAKSLADRLTGKTRNEPTFDFIDINSVPP